jgi:hypothetical protein
MYVDNSHTYHVHVSNVSTQSNVKAPVDLSQIVVFVVSKQVAGEAKQSILARKREENFFKQCYSHDQQLRLFIKIYKVVTVTLPQNKSALNLNLIAIQY